MSDLRDELERGAWQTKADRRTVGTEAMSDRARPREPRREPRLVEVGRERQPREVCVPCHDDPHVRDLAWDLAKLTALHEGRGVRVVYGVPEEDMAKLPDSEKPCGIFGTYDGSHDSLTGLSTRITNMSVFAARVRRIIRDEWEKFCEEEAE